ncbi:unnamed protein product [Gadus morhua 'NCC']
MFVGHMVGPGERGAEAEAASSVCDPLEQVSRAGQMAGPTEQVRQITYECWDRNTEGPSPNPQPGKPSQKALGWIDIKPGGDRKQGIMWRAITSIPVARGLPGDDGEWAVEGSDGPEHKSL